MTPPHCARLSPQHRPKVAKLRRPRPCRGLCAAHSPDIRHAQAGLTIDQVAVHRSPSDSPRRARTVQAAARPHSRMCRRLERSRQYAERLLGSPGRRPASVTIMVWWVALVTVSRRARFLDGRRRSLPMAWEVVATRQDPAGGTALSPPPPPADISHLGLRRAFVGQLDVTYERSGGRRLRSSGSLDLL